jgi:carbamoyltransferase
MKIAGLGGFRSEPACAVLKDGVLASAVEQKKLSRRVDPGELPREAIQMALDLAGVSAAGVDCVALVPPFADGVEGELHLEVRALFPNARLILVEHHTAHAASAFYVSPFEQAAVLTLDRIGDFRCGALWQGSGRQLRLDRELFYPDSLGDVYGRVTELLGFQSNADEHKVQWLSTSGDPAQFSALFGEILGTLDWPRVDRSFFDADRLSAGGFSGKFYARLGLEDEADIPSALRANVAAGLQRATEETVMRMAGDHANICLAGGVAYNALLVSTLERTKNVFVQPASSNAGTAIGAVLHAWHSVYQQDKRAGFDLLLGPAYGPEDIKKVLENCKLRFRYLLTAGELIDSAVRDLADQKIIAWMQGRMEFGPRALGNRSILASPLNPYSTENLNIFIKHREPFRKFAASVPVELCDEYFEAGPNARFLATVGRVRPAHRKTFEGAVLGDGLVRVHTVSAQDNPLYHRLLLAAGKSYGLPVLFNTSFNLFGDPLVCTPRDAVRSFYSSGIDALYAGNFQLEK